MLLSENELPTSPQLFDKQILESVIGSLLSKMKVAAMRNMKAKMRKLFRTLTLLNVVKSVYYEWKDRTMFSKPPLSAQAFWFEISGLKQHLKTGETVTRILTKLPYAAENRGEQKAEIRDENSELNKSFHRLTYLKLKF